VTGPQNHQGDIGHVDHRRRGRRLSRSGVEHGGAAVAQRHGQRRPRLGRRRLHVTRPPGQDRQPRRHRDGEFVEPFAECRRTGRQPTGEAVDPSRSISENVPLSGTFWQTARRRTRTQAEDGRLVAAEVGQPGLAPPGGHQGQGGGDDGGTRAALRRPQDEEHGTGPLREDAAQRARHDGNVEGGRAEGGRERNRRGGAGGHRRHGVHRAATELREAPPMLTGPMEAAFFDLDKTVIAKSSVLAFGRPLYQEGLLSRSALLKSAYNQAIYRLRGADEARMERARDRMLSITRGWEQARVSGIVRETFETIVAPIIYAEALELFEDHLDAGRKIFLVSSSPTEIVAHLADYLGIDECIASRSRVDADGRYTGELEFYAYGPHKAAAILEAAKRDGIDLAASYAYSDSITDVPMLELVGHPV